jgi:CHASE2 domain-containing sensor protein
MRFRIRPHSYLRHVTSFGFLLTLAVVFAADYWLEHTRVVERAMLGGFDTALERSEPRNADCTAVVGITTEDVQRYFGGVRPIPAAGLDSVIRRLLKLDVGVLVVDIFTDDSTYRAKILADSLLLQRQASLVWAQFVDTTSGEVLPAVGGIAVPGRSGVAAMTADEDRLVRRFPLRFATRRSAAGPDTVESLPYAATQALAAHLSRRPRGDAVPCMPVRYTNARVDTGSVGLRTYIRNPSFYLLDDLLSADPTQVTATRRFSDRVVVLGFVDGSDQAITASGVRAGPHVVADAIETLIDERSAITSLPRWAEWLVKLALALLIAFIHYKLPPRVGAAVMIVLAVVVVRASFLILEHTGLWTNYILIVISIWIEQLYANISQSPHHA